jgi:uncharacterized membrane protein (UPF0127 family)
MHRENLPAGQGMLFVFDRPGPRSFWMRNTRIPLDIAYLDPQGIIQEIHPLHPLNENSVASLSQNVQYALEVNRGWFRQHKLVPGTRLDLKPIRQILEKKGIRIAD